MTHVDLRHQSVDQQYIAGHDIYIQQLAAPLSLTVAEYRRNRSQMLAKVRAFWIIGVLEQSLQGVAPIALGLQEQSEAIVNPWQLVVQESNQPAHPLPQGTGITQVYDKAAGELLILGEPGSGKTTLLLQLARDLLDRAEHDESLPMPVVFNLFSWAVKQQPLPDWLTQELSNKYQVPHRLAQAWVDTEQILPLLDGLDEVPQEERASCIATINTYRREHGIISTVVCSRSADYFAQPTRLALRQAVVVQPLSPQQIDDCLTSAGEQLAAVHLALHNDPPLQELATSPLILSILTLTYQGKSVEDLRRAGIPATRRQAFADYVERMLHRREAQTRYTYEQTIQWIGWLARQLVRHRQTEFYLERMQPDWLQERQQHAFPYRIAARLSVGLTSGLVGGFAGLTIVLVFVLLAWLLGNNQLPQMNIMRAGVPFGVVGGLLAGLLHRLQREIKPAEVVAWSWRSMWRSLTNMQSLKSGLLAGLFGGLLAGLAENSASSLLVGLVAGLVVGFLVGLVDRMVSELLGDRPDKQPRSTPHHKKWYSIRNRMLVGVASGLVIWLLTLMLVGTVFGLLLGLLGGLLLGLLSGLLLGLLGGLLGGLTIGLLHHVEVGKKPVEMVAWLWVGIWQRLVKSESLRNGLLSGLLIGLLIGLTSGKDVARWLGVGLLFGLMSGLVFELISGLIGGLSSGMLEKQILIRPNQGIQTSVRNSVSVGLAIWLATGLLFGTGFGAFLWLGYSNPYPGMTPVTGLLYGLLVGLFFGLMRALTIGLSNGGAACIQHAVLRWFIWRAGDAPWNYARFLDYAAEHLLLRKIGGGYIFVHRLLLDYFALLNTTPPALQAKEPEQASLPQVCECGYQDDRPEKRYCPHCGKPTRGSVTPNTTAVSRVSSSQAAPPS